ncbi:MAG: TRC40/GET3/ArsA family transport-energizing ATPase [Bacillota bacterium]|nr:TRC40/GET3/ArsA family transport-energizing ATPase [Bacillota bacterium]
MSETRFLFFSGKGGAGKTSMACTTAVRMASQGLETLIVTTDPASNLADVFEQSIGHRVVPVEGMQRLWAMEIEPDAATQDYKDRALAPVRGLFPKEILQVMEEQMNSPCTAEVAAFDRFTDFIATPEALGRQYNVIIFDTAPTGHTLRLLELPAEWSRTIEEAALSSGQTCIGPAAAIQEQKAKYDRAIETMRDPSVTTFTFVLNPEATSIKEARRSIDELRKLGISRFEIIVNGIVPSTESRNPFMAERIEMQQGYLAQIASVLPFPAKRMYLLDAEIKGVPRLLEVGRMLFDGDTGHHLSGASADAEAVAVVQLSPRESVLDRILPQGTSRRTIFYAGKGGVGKSVLSCVTAVWLARRGLRTLLLTTDPAAHIGDVLEETVEARVSPSVNVPNMFTARIDAKAAAEAYKARILADARKRGRPEEAIRAMAEELDSPCTEEMAAFDEFIAYASMPDWDVVVFDTAPTGHTLRLLELPVDWSAQLNVKIFASVDTAAADDVAKQRFGEVIAMMRDPAKATFAFVMYPESTPITEAYRAIKELETIGIHPGLIVANQVLQPEVCVTPYTRSRRAMQVKYLSEMRERFSAPILQVPLMPREIRGVRDLTRIGEQVLGPVQ